MNIFQSTAVELQIANIEASIEATKQARRFFSSMMFRVENQVVVSIQTDHINLLERCLDICKAQREIPLASAS